VVTDKKDTALLLLSHQALTQLVVAICRYYWQFVVAPFGSFNIGFLNKLINHSAHQE